MTNRKNPWGTGIRRGGTGQLRRLFRAKTISSAPTSWLGVSLLDFLILGHHPIAIGRRERRLRPRVRPEHAAPSSEGGKRKKSWPQTQMKKDPSKSSLLPSAASSPAIASRKEKGTGGGTVERRSAAKSYSKLWEIGSELFARILLRG
jgi:hypothetical protein